METVLLSEKKQEGSGRVGWGGVTGWLAMTCGMQAAAPVYSLRKCLIRKCQACF